ncbi:polysaccharide pyruvyl transferase family protein [Thiomicrorhabdus aquaedulcis]|uniref:polysaccharide pyruvyl transferase family protein n=1 Tax=Thiomicrorhabdus aquaedulcis TaxID=2211106 RepID=UPI000FD95B53|nr:polysaccharide pyruvyl transferase family protein [Thiomicrorhabdus aquaedulcis]
MRVAIINDTRPTSHYGCLMVMKNLESLLEAQGVEVVWTWPVGRDWRKNKAGIRQYPSVDAVIVNGEGTIHHGSRRWQAQALVEFAAFAHNELKVPCFLLNATLFANDASIYEFIREFDGVYVRDRSSYKTLLKHNILAEFVADMTFALPASAPYKPEKGRVCVIDSVMQSDVPHLKRFSRRYHAKYCSMIVARPSNYCFWKRPRKYFVESIKWLLGDRKRSLEPSSFEAYLAQCDLVVTGRYHTVTMCLKNKIPFVALESNTPKITFLLKEVFGHSKRVIRAEELEHLQLEHWKPYLPEELDAIDKFLSKAEEGNFAMLKSVVLKVQTFNQVNSVEVS